MKIGLLGGTFDPPHNGHLALAEEAKIKFDLDEIWFVPAGNPYFKTAVRNVTHSYIRMTMTNIAVAGVSWAFANDCEVVHDGPSYTSETLDYLHKQYPEHEFYFIIGADDLRDITSWHNFQEIFANCTIIAAHRSSEQDDDIFRSIGVQLTEQYGAKILFLPFHNYLSSTLIREKIRAGRSYRFDVPMGVYDYIKKYKLYGAGVK